MIKRKYKFIFRADESISYVTVNVHKLIIHRGALLATVLVMFCANM